MPGHCLKEGSRAASMHLALPKPYRLLPPCPAGGHRAGGSSQIYSHAWFHSMALGDSSPAQGFPLGVLPQPDPALCHQWSGGAPGSWGARAAAQPLVGLPSHGKEGLCAPKAAQVAPARRQAALPQQQQQQIRFVCPAFAGPTKQVLILLNKYEVMAAGLGAKRPGDILGSRVGSAVGQEQRWERGWGRAELLAAGPAGWSRVWSRVWSQAGCWSRCGPSPCGAFRAISKWLLNSTVRSTFIVPF